MIRVNTGSYDPKRPRLRVNRNTLATEMDPLDRAHEGQFVH